MEEFDVDMDDATGLNWKDATAQLTLLYGQRDHVPDYSIAQLKKFIEDHSTTSSFTDKADISDYYRDFLRISAPLLKKQKITKEESQFYFIAGIPKRLKDWFTGEVPSDKRTRADPPTIAQSIKILYKRFDEESISYEPWNDRVETNVLDEATRPSEPTDAKSPAQNDVNKTNLDLITQRLEELSLNLARLNSQQAEQRKCFMCFKVGTHPLGLRHCPETRSLLDENLIKFDTNNQRYVLMNGTDLPRTPNGFRGGVAAYIRSQREMARASVAGLTYGSSQVFANDNIFAVSSLGHWTSNADPVTRSGKDTGVRFAPTKRPEPKGKEPESAPPAQDRPPVTQPVPGPSASGNPAPPAKNVNIPPPTNPINRLDGWKNSRPSNNRKTDDDVVMRDVKRPTGDKFHITSDVQERTDQKALVERIFQTQITLPLIDILGASPSLQKIITDSTRSRREYTSNKNAEYYVHPEEETYSEEIFTPQIKLNTHAGEARHLHVGDTSEDDLASFFVAYGNAISQVPAERFFAMTTGTMLINIGNVQLKAMIDTGSELNLASASVVPRCNLAVDFEGMRWALKGIHGEPEQLRGCATDVPIRIGGHAFPHHLFISHQELGAQDLILGQPFLQWFGSRLEYERGGHVSLFLWKDGIRKGPPTIGIPIANPDDSRNATSINRNNRAAYVEDVTDEEDF
jgi:hypothetical protein